MAENSNQDCACKNCKCGNLNLLEKFPEKKQELEAYIDSLDMSYGFERRQGFLIACLHKAQGIFGYLPLEVQELVGKKLGLQQSTVYGVISFYSYFTDEPVGKYKINVCTGTACFVRGADKVMAGFKEKLKLEEGKTSADMKYSLTSIRCVGACSLAPVVMVNERVYGNVTPAMVDKIIEDCV